jgi:hypothetical protein
VKRTRHVILRTTAQASAVKLACGALLALGNDGAGATAVTAADGTPTGQHHPTPSPSSARRSADVSGSDQSVGAEQATRASKNVSAASEMQQQPSLLLRISDKTLEIHPGPEARHPSADPDVNNGQAGAVNDTGALQQQPIPVAKPTGNESNGVLGIVQSGRLLLHVPLPNVRTTEITPGITPATMQHKKRSVS